MSKHRLTVSWGYLSNAFMEAASGVLFANLICAMINTCVDYWFILWMLCTFPLVSTEWKANVLSLCFFLWAIKVNYVFYAADLLLTVLFEYVCVCRAGSLTSCSSIFEVQMLAITDGSRADDYYQLQYFFTMCAFFSEQTHYDYAHTRWLTLDEKKSTWLFSFSKQSNWKPPCLHTQLTQLCLHKGW